MAKSTTINVGYQVKIPTVPNYLIYGEGDNDKIHIADVKEESLRQIGAAWTEALIERSKEANKLRNS